jgi:hypothetical protein
MTLLLADERSVVAAFDTLEEHEKASGSKLNMDKTEGMFFCYQAGKAEGPVAIRSRNNGLHILGATFNTQMVQDWLTPLCKMQQKLHMWSARRLTIKGRAIIAKTFVHHTKRHSTTNHNSNIQVSMARRSRVYKQNNPSETHRRRRPGHSKPPGVKPNSQTQAKFEDHGSREPKQLGLMDWLLATVQGWTTLRDNNKPHADLESLPPPWHKEIETYLNQNREAVETAMHKNRSLTTRRLRLLADETETTRAITKWEERKVPPQQVKLEWAQGWHSLNTPEERELKWRTLHWSLPINSYLATWRHMGVTKQCPFCEEETTAHALLTCHRLKPAWAYVNNLLHRLDYDAVTSLAAALFPKPDSPLPEYLLSTTIFSMGHLQHSLATGRDKT